MFLFLSRWNPSWLPRRHKVLSQWAGREEELFETLAAKYGPEPHVDLLRSASELMIQELLAARLESVTLDEHGRRHTLLDDLRARAVDALIVAGLATDYCVKASVLDARKHGLAAFLFLPGVRAVDLAAGDGDRAAALMRESGAHLVQ